MKVLHINTVFGVFMRLLAKNIEQNPNIEQFFIVKESLEEKTENVFQEEQAP